VPITTNDSAVTPTTTTNSAAIPLIPTHDAATVTPPMTTRPRRRRTGSRDRSTFGSHFIVSVLVSSKIMLNKIKDRWKGLSDE